MAFTRTAGVQFGAPAFVLTTANAAGSTRVAVESDADLLAFDATDPAAVSLANAAAVGVATVAARRDHVHASTGAHADVTGITTNQHLAAPTQAELEAETDAQRAFNASLLRNAPSALKWRCSITAAGLLSSPSYNIASVTDTGTGDRTIVFDVDFSTAVFTALALDSEGNSAERRYTYSTFAVGSVRFLIFDTTPSAIDMASTNAGFGDQ